MSQPLFIVWNEDINLNIPIIDEQHKAFVALVNSFHIIMTKGKGYQLINKNRAIIIQHLAELHFQTEERIMEISEYPGLDEHIKQHKKIMRDIQKTVQEVLNSGDATIALNFLKDWWINHIKDHDIELGKYLNNIGFTF